MKTQSIGGLKIQPIGLDTATEYVVELARNRRSAQVHLANAYTIALADRDDAYRQILNRGIVFADGKPITWFSHLSRQTPPIRQVRGPQLFLDVLDKGRASGVRHFLLGSTDEVLQRMRNHLVARFSGWKSSACTAPHSVRRLPRKSRTRMR